MSRPELCQIVRERGVALGALIDTWGETSRAALADGRVFVDGARALDRATLLEPGSRVEVYARRDAVHEELKLLFQSRGLAALAKPTGIATEPDHAGISSSLVVRAAELFGVPSGSVHACSRLDVGVSGLVLVALDAEARRRVELWRERGELARRYVAIAAGVPTPSTGAWRGAIGRARGSKRSVGGRDAREAETRYAVGGLAGDNALLALEPVSGRTHQLRVHAAHAGLPFYGDNTYGGPKRVVQADGAVQALSRIALHAAWVRLPLGGGTRIEAPVPDELVALWETLAGSASDFERVLADPLPPGA